MKEKIMIPLKGRTAVLSVEPFSGEVDVEQTVQIDYSNILGEILTFPVIFNRIANLRADAANALAIAKFDTDAFEAQLYEEKKNSLGAADKKPSIKDIDMAVMRDNSYRVKKRDLFEIQKFYDYCDALYWSAQSKDTKLNKLADRLKPEEFENEILESTINGISIKIKRNVIN